MNKFYSTRQLELMQEIINESVNKKNDIKEEIECMNSRIRDLLENIFINEKEIDMLDCKIEALKYEIDNQILTNTLRKKGKI